MSAIYSCDSDFATELLVSTNTIQRSFRGSNQFGRNWRNIDVKQADEIHRAMHHRPHQSEY